MRSARRVVAAVAFALLLAWVPRADAATIYVPDRWACDQTLAGARDAGAVGARESCFLTGAVELSKTWAWTYSVTFNRRGGCSRWDREFGVASEGPFALGSAWRFYRWPYKGFSSPSPCYFDTWANGSKVNLWGMG